MENRRWNLPISPPRLTNDAVIKFPKKLWRIANSCTTGAIFWNNDGSAIKLHKAKFEKQYLSSSASYFKTRNFLSFVRQLNIYGFRKITKSARDNYLSYAILEYEHPKFRRGHPELLSFVERNTKKTYAERENEGQYIKTKQQKQACHNRIHRTRLPRNSENRKSKSKIKLPTLDNASIKSLSNFLHPGCSLAQGHVHQRYYTHGNDQTWVSSTSDFQNISPTKIHQQVMGALNVRQEVQHSDQSILPSELNQNADPKNSIPVKEFDGLVDQPSNLQNMQIVPIRHDSMFCLQTSSICNICNSISATSSIHDSAPNRTSSYLPITFITNTDSEPVQPKLLQVSLPRTMQGDTILTRPVSRGYSAITEDIFKTFSKVNDEKNVFQTDLSLQIPHDDTDNLSFHVNSVKAFNNYVGKTDNVDGYITKEVSLNGIDGSENLIIKAYYDPIAGTVTLILPAMNSNIDTSEEYIVVPFVSGTSE
ncbi:hypothetical protein CHS0354_024696 [Potamilus streckersoni]|uniref:HSF-type DNA-binding domain-containing protein n=1 Tax=Potamilus streckersoni TaxID=2493646 RepID=A0AAE0RX39_9BIVA|nr:hypothetical protein CHS0354_024696 [Potamilus streckersoni]